MEWASVWSRVKRVLRREAEDVREGMAALGEKIDAGLDRRQRELDATPSERVEMIVGEMDEVDRRLDEIAATVRDDTDPADAGLERPADGPSELEGGAAEPNDTQA